MKTAYKRVAIFGLTLVAFAIPVSFAHALDAAAQNGIVPPPTLTAANAPAPALTPLADDSGKGERGLTGTEDKAVDQAKNVMRRLGATDSMTLEDLNSANQTIAKLNALIDIEKHLNELEKLRDEREGKSSFASAIPASALAPHFPAQTVNVMPTPMPTPESMPQAQPQIFSAGGNEVVRIIGAGGRYTAIVKTADGQTREVQTGDHLAGLGTVVSVGATGIEVEQNHSRHQLKVKNVNLVFGNTP